MFHTKIECLLQTPYTPQTNTSKGTEELFAYCSTVLPANQLFCAYLYYYIDGMSNAGF